jgi:hypothetical protein
MSMIAVCHQSDLRMLQRRGHVEHFAGRNAVRVEQVRPFGRRTRRQRLLDLGIERVAVALSVLAAGEAWIGLQFVAADQTA